MVAVAELAPGDIVVPAEELFVANLLLTAWSVGGIDSSGAASHGLLVRLKGTSIKAAGAPIELELVLSERVLTELAPVAANFIMNRLLAEDGGVR